MNISFEVPLVVSYYTLGTSYEKEVEALIGSCQKFQIEHHIEGVQDLGSWEQNCAYKPYFLKEKMRVFQRPLLWVDADAVFLKPLQFEEFMFSDISAAYDLDVADSRFAVFAGTLYINSSVGGRECLDRWCEYSDRILQEKGKERAYTDQESLYFALTLDPRFSFLQLPLSHAKIFDQPAPGLLADDVVIQHHQASRKLGGLKEKIEWKKIVVRKKGI